MPGVTYRGTYTLKSAIKYAKYDSHDGRTYYINKQTTGSRYTINEYAANTVVAAYKMGKRLKMQKNPGSANDLVIRLVKGSKDQFKSLLRKAGYAVGTVRKAALGNPKRRRTTKRIASRRR